MGTWVTYSRVDDFDSVPGRDVVVFQCHTFDELRFACGKSISSEERGRNLEPVKRPKPRLILPHRSR